MDNTNSILLWLFNRDAASPIQCIVFSALHCDSGILFARTHPKGRLYMGGHTTKYPGLYAPEGALLDAHPVGVTTFSLLDLYARSEAPAELLSKHFQAAPREQWAVSFIVVAVGEDTAAAHPRQHTTLTIRVRFASPFASPLAYLEAKACRSI